MSKTLGYILLLGLLGSVLLSLGLLTWVWIQSSGSNNSSTPTPRTGVIWSAEPVTTALVDARLGWADFTNGGLTSNFDDKALACA